MQAIRNADRVVARLHSAPGKWREAEFFPVNGEGILQTLARVRVCRELMTHPRRSNIVLYLGAMVRGERLLAVVPKVELPIEEME
jgi:hypothetical protein